MDIIDRLLLIWKSYQNSTKNTEGYDNEENNGSHSSQNEYTATYQKKDDKLAQYYSNLELPYGASSSEVKENFYRLMRKYHPDNFQNDNKKKAVAEEITKRLNEAYGELKKRGDSSKKYT